VRISRALLDEMVAHAREDAPGECCGIVGARDGEAVEVRRVKNVAPSPPFAFEMDSMGQYHAQMELEDAGLELGAIYHSHTRSDPQPSLTDIRMAKLWPDPLWIIVGVQHDEAEVRAFSIRDGQVTEVELEVA
jgi:[CysO sulfur-carrier protein]-S-L-cysteine hydrolase